MPRNDGSAGSPARILTLLIEDLGEVARELQKTRSPSYGELDVERLAPELADGFVLLSALASEYEIDLASAIQSKFFRGRRRRGWPSADLS